MKKLLIPIFLMALFGLARADLEISVQEGVSGLTSNSVIDIGHDSPAIWLGTGGGASVSANDGVSWTTYGRDPLPGPEVSALDVNDRAAWVANSHSEAAAGDEFPYGDGISFTRDGGLNWTILHPEQASFFGKLSYDLSLYDSMAFAACFYGGLIRTTDWGATWQNLFPTQLDSSNTDSIDYHLGNYRSLSNRAFAVKTDTTAFPDTFSVWSGTARGIYRFFFLADSLTAAFHSYPDSIAHYAYDVADTLIPDSLKLPGNHVVGLGINFISGVKTVWAACRPVVSGEDRGAAYTTDDGATWHTANIADPSGDTNVEAWDFAFDGATVLVATSFGLYESTGNYSSWILLSRFVDEDRQTFYQDNAPFYAVDIVDGVVWAGGTDGVVRRLDGDQWRVFRSQLFPADHYAYPSPFSPEQSIRGGTTIHFLPNSDTQVSVKIYDFNMDLVRTVASNLPRRGGVESDDIVWNGTNDDGRTVANGVYFYRIELDSGDDLWGKVVVIR